MKTKDANRIKKIFVQIVFDIYLNFMKLSNISKIFSKASTKFQ